MLLADCDVSDDRVVQFELAEKGISSLAENAFEGAKPGVRMEEALDVAITLFGDKRVASPVNVDPEFCFEVEAWSKAVPEEVPCNLLKRDGSSIFCCGLIAPALVAVAECVSSAPPL